MEQIRIQKYFTDCGVLSRRAAEAAIDGGEITVNGAPALIGQKIDPEKDIIKYRGRVIRPTYREDSDYMLNKPRGYVTTMSDERGRKCVAELVADVEERVYPVGRLDRDSEGMLLFTNDGDFANKIMHPKKDIYKVYRVTVRPAVTDEMLQQFEEGMMLDGRKTAPAEVRVITRQEGRVVLEILLREGRNRQIRRMCEMLGLEVARLRRTAIGGVKMGMLKKGDWRDLTQDEVKKLMADPNPSRHIQK